MAEQSNEKPTAAPRCQKSVATKKKKEIGDLITPDDVAIRLDASAQALIGQQLRAVYGEIVNQPVPDHLLKLLEELQGKDEAQ
jgi:uncharacterized Fe-S cluster-containing radical SAM superfamily protein